MWAARAVLGARVPVSSNRPNRLVFLSFRNPGTRTRRTDSPQLPRRGKTRKSSTCSDHAFDVAVVLFCSPRTSTVGRPNGLRVQQPSTYTGNAAPTVQTNKNSVLDKFKLFNNKEKNQERGKASSGVSKRTSSSSGFSSARSEHSDSSTSLCDQSKSQQACQESPKSRALKSKLQSAAKLAKQTSPKSGRKEQSKAQSKIARTKAPPSSTEKLTATALYNNPILQEPEGKREIAGGKMISIKLPNDRKTPNVSELAKQPQIVQSQKTNTCAMMLAMPRQQINPQDIKNANVKNEPPNVKPTSRPKMELPVKLQDPKIHLQNIKSPPNGLNKDFMLQKTILANTNGIIKPSEPDGMIVRENDTFDRTLSMNQANLSDGKDLAMKRKEPELLEIPHEERSMLENFGSSLSKIQESNRNKVICEGELESAEIVSDEKEASSFSNHMDSVTDEKPPESAEEGPTSPRGNPPATLNNLNFESGKSLAGSNNFQNQNPSGAGISPGSSIPKPTALVKGTSKPPKESGVTGAPTPTKPKCDALHRKLDPNTVALVSPMPSISDLMSESSHSNSNSTGQSNSSDSSVIYRPSSESGSEIKTIPNRKIDTTFEQMEKVGRSRIFFR